MVRKKSYRKSYRKKIKKPFYKKSYFCFSVIIFLFFALATYFLVFFEYFQIKEIEISGNEKIKTEEVNYFIEEEISKSFYWINSASIFLSSPRLIAQKIMEDFSIIGSLRIERVYPDKIIVQIKERRSVGRLCSGECFLMDSSGFLFAKSEERGFLNINMDNGEKYFIGKKAVSHDDIKSIIYIYNELLGSVEVYDFYLNDFNLRAQTKEGWEIHFNLMDDVPLQTLKLLMILEEEVPENRRKDIEYIDLRFQGRAYYKYR